MARQGFEALMTGKAEVVAGSLRNKVQTTASRVMRESAKAKMQGKLTEPGSAG